MKIKYVLKVDEVWDIQPAVKQDESGKTIPKIASDGSPVFAMLCLFKTKQKIGLKEAEIRYDLRQKPAVLHGEVSSDRLSANTIPLNFRFVFKQFKNLKVGLPVEIDGLIVCFCR